MKRKGNIINGWIALDKPPGITSTQAVGKVRRILNAQKIGHGGTLDPLATGILPIALGEATKTIAYIQDHIKTYTFTITWGEQRSTDDAEGDVIATSPVIPTEQAILAALSAFTGDIWQTPPQFSAIKIDGERAYDIARDGGEVEMKPRPVYIEFLEYISSQTSPRHRDDKEKLENQSTFRCTCGKGTYIRSLGRDLALSLGTVGYISALRRDRVGPMGPENAISLEKLEEIHDSALLPVDLVLDGIPALKLTQQEVVRLKNGQKLSFVSRPDVERLRTLDLRSGDTALAVYDGKPVALVTISGIDIQPVRVLNL